MSPLFSSLKIGDVQFRNRIFVSPMCQYSSHDGMPNDWHLVHLGSRAVGGAGLVCVEASAVTPEGRISPGDTGLWSDAHSEAFARITRFLRDQGSVAAIQLAHAGRKASCDVPWRGGKALADGQGAWTTLAPSAIPFAETNPAPHALDDKELDELVAAFAAAARRAQDAGFECVEVHMAHGYLLHEFLSPLSNRRDDQYGGSLENRMRLPLRVTAAVREVWPANLPLFVRISATDWMDGGWDLEQSLVLSRELKALGVDVIDCSGGGLVPNARIPVGPGYQTPFAETIRHEVGIATIAVGMITEPVQAEHILRTGQADAVMLARELLRDPYWPLHAAQALHTDVAWPVQYERAKP
ncbi:MAG: NADH:flavin oxidoreductase/NADH oxidase [Gammaproteobacteria bacterium]|jgi:2,4-dienoyl-CoA reductase-like NADH-dependent reductase (Old Yellow Enzyme family)